MPVWVTPPRRMRPRIAGPRARAGRRSAGARAADKLARFRPLPRQATYLASPHRRKQLRGPNQGGKTTTLAVLLLCMMLGPDHPSVLALCARVPGLRANLRRRATEGWVVCTSWKQSLTVQRKVHAMLPPGALHPESKYTRKNGFTGQRFQTVNGSLCTFVTTKQDTDELASATLDYVLIDEVPSEEIYGELAARVRHLSGFIGIHYTPINRPVEWLRAKVEKKEIEDHHFELTLEALTPVGSRFPIQSQQQIDDFVLDCPPWQYGQRVLGAWEGATEGRWMQRYDPTRHDRDDPPPYSPEWVICVGMDYGLQPGKMAAHLAAGRNGGTTRPEVCFWDEVAAGDDEVWSMEEFVERILAMLRRNGLSYDSVDLWTGDRSAVGKGGKVSNREMRAHFAAALGRTQSQVKAISTPRKGALSVEYGCGVINAVFARNSAWVNRRCVQFRKFLAHFAGNVRDKTKDAGDAARYAFLELVNPSAWYKIARAA